MTTSVLTRAVPAAVPGFDPCGGTGRVFRGGRFPEVCPLGCAPQVVKAYGCPDCGHLPGCDCDCCPYPMPA